MVRPCVLLLDVSELSFSDYNYVRNGDKCVPVGPEPIPAGVCTGAPGQTYQGSSGYRLIPGNLCTKQNGVEKDKKVEKSCSQGYNFGFIVLQSS